MTEREGNTNTRVGGFERGRGGERIKGRVSREGIAREREREREREYRESIARESIERERERVSRERESIERERERVSRERKRESE